MAFDWRVYRSTDSGAPTIDGLAGSFATSISLILSGPSGDGSGYAYGTKPCAGWTEEYTGTNQVALRYATGSRFFFNINDNSPSGGSKFLRITGYEQMTGIGTGTHPFPATYISPMKSVEATSTAVPWVVFADGSTAIILLRNGFVDWFDTGLPVPAYAGIYLGDFYSYKPGDAYKGACIGRGNVTETDETRMQEPLMVNQEPVGNVDKWYRRDCAETDAAVYLGSPGHGLVGHSYNGLLSGATNPADGKVILAPIPIGQLRGELRGIYQLGHFAGAVTEGNTYTLPGGRTVEVFWIQYGGDFTGEIYKYKMAAICLESPAFSV